MTTQPTCPTCGGDGRIVARGEGRTWSVPCPDLFSFAQPFPDVSGDEEWDEFRTHEHFGNRLGDRTHCCYRAGLNARRNPQQTDEAIRAMAQRIAAELSHDYLRDFGIGITAIVADRIADVLRGEK
jgi:hypothetical protein